MLPQLFFYFAAVVVAAPMSTQSLRLRSAADAEKYGTVVMAPKVMSGKTWEEAFGYPDPEPERRDKLVEYGDPGTLYHPTEKQAKVAEQARASKETIDRKKPVPRI